jgi:hypothetical protein
VKPQSANDAMLSSTTEFLRPQKRKDDVDPDARNQVVHALARLDAWIEAEGFKGWDPYDALNSPALRWAGSRQRLLGIAMVQLLRRSPLNLRPLLGIRKGHNPKAMGLFLSAYAQKFIATRQEGHLEQTRYFFDWLVEHASVGYSGPCWGYNFDWPNRGFLALAGTPTIVNTSFIGLSFLSAEPALGASANQSGLHFPVPPCRTQGKEQWQEADGLTIARTACEFILQDLHALRPRNDEICFSYTPIDRRFVHNANLLGAWLLAAVYARTKEGRLAEAAMAAARFTVRRQRADGSWAYGIAMRDGWVDNFHTGYVLVALNRIASYLDTDEFHPALQAGYEFWKTRMFLSGVVPKYYPDSLYPIDIHSVAQAILTYLEFFDVDPDANECAWRVAAWVVAHMQDPGGFFHYQIRRSYRIRIPYMRWSQAWMQRALTALCAGNNGGQDDARVRPATSLGSVGG